MSQTQYVKGWQELTEVKRAKSSFSFSKGLGQESPAKTW